MDDPKLQVVQGRYRLLRCVGEGSQGRVYLAEDLARGGEQVAVKVVEAMVGGHRDNSADGILRWFRHPNWASVLDGGSLGSDGWFQVTRFISGQNLESLEGPQSEERVWRFLECGARVLGALHRQGIIHYDITPGNWMLEDREGEPNFVLTDGGLAHEGPVSGLGRGTPRYMAPEVTKDGEHDHRCDLYSLGLVAFRLATGRDPFEGRAGEVLGKRRRLPAPRARTYRPELSEKLDGVLSSLLEREPNARPQNGRRILEDLVCPEAMTTEEALAASVSGSTHGRGDVLARFARLSLGLGARAGGRQVPFVQRDRPRMPESVLLLTGPSGSGSTRSLVEMQNLARESDIAVLPVRGDGRSADSLVDSLSTSLAYLMEWPIPRGRRKNRVDGGVHALQRRLEQVISQLVRAARTRPTLLIVEDYGSLSDDGREVVQVLSRFLIARHEAARGVNSLPIAMIVDVGDASTDGLVLPDSLEPLKPVVSLARLPDTALRSICEERFPGLVLDEDSWSSVSRVAEGRPGNIVRLLEEGLARKDLAPVPGGWMWDTSRVEDYPLERTLSARERLWVDSCTGDVAAALSAVALVAVGVPLSLLERLGVCTLSPYFDRVTTTVEIEGVPRVRPRSREISGYIIERMGDRSIALSKSLSALAQSGPEIEAAASAVANSRDRDLSAIALARLLEAMGPRASRPIVEKLVGLAPLADMNDSLAVSLSSYLLARPSLVLAERLAQPEALSRLAQRGRVVVAETLERFDDSTAALRVLLQSDQENVEPSEDVFRRIIAVARIQLHRHAVDNARTTLRQARRTRAATTKSFSDETNSRYALVLAQAAFFRTNSARARSLLARAARWARAARMPSLVADSYNGLGVIEQADGNLAQSERLFRRTSRLRMAMGDVSGVVRVRFNLGRVLHERGELAVCAATLQQTTALAMRHAQYASASQCLRALGRVYDEQMNARLALSTLQRADREARSNQAHLRIAFIAWDLAPLAAATGCIEDARRALVTSAQSARNRVTPYSRAMHRLVSALVHTHCGHERARRLSALRASRERAALPSSAQAQLDIVLLLSGTRPEELMLFSDRPQRGHSNRELARLQAVALRVSRSQRGVGYSASWRFLSRRAGVSGAARRLFSECALRALVEMPGSVPQERERAIDRQHSHSGETMIRARLLATMSCHRVAMAQSDSGHSFSRAVEILAQCDAVDRGPLAEVPTEFSAAYNALSKKLGFSQRLPQTLLSTDLHALAHRALIAEGGASVTDDRVSTALRNVLDASAELKASGDIDQLLDTITRKALDITGAERVSIVRVVAGQQHHATTAVSPSRGTPPSRPVSDAVIARVLSGHKPLLLHDVFDDEELMQRPSITGLSLRSIMCVPLLRGDNIHGIMYADDASAAASFDQIDLEILSLFAEQVAATLETKRLLDDLHESMDALRAAQEKLVRGERLRVIGEISSGVAHEFNNILTGILARVQLAKLSPLPPAIAQDLTLIEKASLDAAEIVRNLQSFSRAERQRDFSELDLGEIVTEGVEFLRPLWARRRTGDHARMTVRLICDTGVSVRGSGTELREVVTNLLKNALDASVDNGTIQVRAFLKNEHAILEVQDSGPGIPSEILERVFDPFFTTKGEKGTGLGLALCQQIVERHGGSLGISATSEEGTTVTVELPVFCAIAQAELGTSRAPDQRPLKVLVIDDDENVRRPLCEYLDRAGHAVKSAADGSEALEIAPEQQPDIAIADVSMPNVDGLEFCRRVRRVSPKTVVILMSGLSSEIDASVVQAAGAATLIAKPFALHTMVKLLSEYAPHIQQK